MALEPGHTHQQHHVVAPEHTAEALGSGDVPVLATPQVLAWCEAATVAALAGHLAPGETTVGMRVRLEHVAPTGVGGEVVIRAVLGAVDGRRLTFDVEVVDGSGTVCASGQVIRVLVERDRFLARLG